MLFFGGKNYMLVHKDDLKYCLKCLFEAYFIKGCLVLQSVRKKPRKNAIGAE